MPTRDTLVSDFRPIAEGPAVEWSVSDLPVAYQSAIEAMDARVEAIRRGTAVEAVWLLEHPALYTAGTSARAADLLDPGLPVVVTGRGGQYTYHGPGQRIAYAMLDLSRRRADVRAYVAALETWIIDALASFAVRADRREDRVGVWVARPDKVPALDGRPAEDKIAAIGIRVRHWISLHGLAVNVEPDLSHYRGIVPCGIGEQHLGVTSLVDLGLPVTMADLDVALRGAFEALFGPTVSAPAPF